METLNELNRINTQLHVLLKKANKELDTISQNIDSLVTQYAIINCIERCTDTIDNIKSATNLYKRCLKQSNCPKT